MPDHRKLRNFAVTRLRVITAIVLVLALAYLDVAVTKSASAATSDPVVVAAGDISCDPSNANFNGLSNATTCQQAATASEIESINPQYLLPLGDEQYVDNATEGQQPTVTQYKNGYGSTWGQIAGHDPGIVIHPVPGNHDYGDVNHCETSCFPACSSCIPYWWSASSYWQYFGSGGLGDLPPGVNGPSSDWYSFDVPVNGGTWHVIALDTLCDGIGGCGTGSPEETWLQNDLATHQGECILVEQHHPRWASGDGGNDSFFATLWNDEVNYHVTAVLVGHDHLYEHFNPMDANGNPSSSGTSEFIVGTGGFSQESYADQPSPPPAALAAEQDTQFGVLKMTLHATGMDYQYQGLTSTLDSGTLPCSAPPPTLGALSPTSGPSTGGTSVTITGANFMGATSVHFGTTAASSFTVNSATSITATSPAGTSTVDVTVTGAGGTSVTGPSAGYSFKSPGPGPGPGSASAPGPGYWLVDSTGHVYAFGSAAYLGGATPPRGSSAVGITSTPDGGGYWIVTNRGNVYAFGDALYAGGAPSLQFGESVVSLSPTIDGAGYWLFTSAGRDFPYGDAASHGSLAGVSLNGPVVSSVVTPSGNGYYMAAADGGIFTFGDARFSGSMGGQHLNKPIVGEAPDPGGAGYWEVASDGGIFSFGGAPFHGSMGGQHLNEPVVGLVPYGDGYLLIASDGGIFDFSSSPYLGSLGSNPPASAIVGVTSVA